MSGVFKKRSLRSNTEIKRTRRISQLREVTEKSQDYFGWEYRGLPTEIIHCLIFISL